VAAYYDAPPTRSYFSSCSTGGRQALIEAQRYPDDFDGIVAGDPSWDQMRLYAARVWLNVYVNRTPSAVIPPSKYPMIHKAVLDKCDALDGVKDGVIEDPSRCSFDFATLICAGEDRPDCLTKDQVETATAMTSPIRDPKSGAILHPGRYYPGSELGWGGVAGPKPSGESHEGMRKIVFTPDWDYHAIKVPDDVERAVKADKGLLYGGDPNLSRFFSRGGKLLMYHGWADPLVSPDTSLIMFKRISDAGGPSAASSVALFMVPGMTHCQGGPGTDVFDKVATLDRWVESGAKPRSIVASHMTSGVVDRTRPLCAYPATAHYTGSGSTDDAMNFRCQMEARSPGNTAASQDAAKTAPAPGRAVATSSATAGNVTQARVLAEAGRGDNWLVNGGNFESQHFSPLKSMTDQNIGRLGLAWSLDVVSPMGLSAEPIVVDGVIYLGAPFDKVYAIDGATGRLRWQFDPHIRINGPWRNS
jgi:feruloyl esterase